MDLMKIYIEQERFGEFVYNVLEMDFERQKEDEEKESNNKLWLAYLISMSELPFDQWKKNVLNNADNASNKPNKKINEPESLSMTDEQVENAKLKARGILHNFSPS